MSRKPRTRRTKAPSGDYAVGYGRPPLHSRFKAGQSGNPKGRPPRQRNITTIVREAAGKRITLREAGRSHTVTWLDAFVQNIFAKALAGDPKAIASLLLLLKATGQLSQEELTDEARPLTAEEQAVVARMLASLRGDPADEQ